MPLYRVQIEDVILVQAESAEAAQRDLAAHLQGEYRINGFKGCALIERARESDVPEKWLDSFPWGGKGDRTVREILQMGGRNG